MNGQTIALVAAVGYAAASAAYGLYFFKREPKAGRVASLLLYLVAATHVVWFANERVALGYLPIKSAPQALSLVALGIALAYVVVEWRLGRREFGFFIVPVVLLFKAVAAVFLLNAPPPEPLDEIYQSGWFEIHVGTALFSYCAFGIAFGAGVMHILLFHELRLKKLGFFFDRLPPLDVLERINRHAVALGFLLLTVGIGTGVFWSLQALGSSSLLQPKEVSALVIWLAYAANIHMRWQMGWRGQRAAIFSVVNFVMIFVLFCLTSLVLKGHQF